ncbi:MAG: 16S rRNA (guanine(527)-N(7))-methyltransferase RsmG [Chitinophagaceae bacterium]|nr:16S rRNA (guanine(527)-N(7))-methyltransferase RsmG [Rubrivivax sp.]
MTSISLEHIADELGLALTQYETVALTRYVALLHRWNGSFNLTSVRSVDAMGIRHLADCLAVVPPLRRVFPSGRGRMLDAGSGGGLPGVVLAICDSGWDVTCVDAVAKKVAFVRQAAGELGLTHVHALHGRVEALELPRFDLITSRAFASLSDFVTLTRHLLSDRGVWLAMKGKRPDDELLALPEDIDVFHVEPLQVPALDEERCLVWMRIKSTGKP